ncbi:MAG: hypothetical protein A3E81_01165 [Gammaproteobacteria bacterium RIFCSPHIGHO2_12_FULL_36_30]|nr:MAG: hypothetical protein A3E81_01165 [Gammaproteobacteria bacterium RIFCSPHIGHO2_12_FULL_36_30]
MYSPSLPCLSRIFNTTYTEIAYTLTAYLLGYAVSVLFFGGISDQLGIKRSYVFTTLIFIFTSLLLSITHSIHFFILLRLLQGIGGGGCAVIARTSARNALDGKKLVSAMSYISISFIISLGIFQYVGGIIQTYMNYRYDFIVMGCFSFFLLMLILFQFHEVDYKLKRQFKIVSLVKNYTGIVKQNYLIPLALGGGIGYSILLAFNLLGIFYLQNHLKLSPHDIGIIGIYFSVAYLFGSFLVNNLIKITDIHFLMKIGKTIIFIAGILSVIGILINPNSPVLIISPILIGLIGQALLYPCAMTKALEPYKKIPGAASSLFGFTQQMSGFVVVMIVGWLPNQSIMLLSIVIFIVGLLSFLLSNDRSFQHQKIETN